MRRTGADLLRPAFSVAVDPRLMWTAPAHETRHDLGESSQVMDPADPEYSSARMGVSKFVKRGTSRNAQGA